MEERNMQSLLARSLLGIFAARVCMAATVTVTADVAVDSPVGQYAQLEVGEFVNSNAIQYYWLDVPPFADGQDFLFWQVETAGDPAEGITTFEVLTDGPVLLACTTRWGGGGNSSGNWEHEVTTRAELEAQGWGEFATGMCDTRDDWEGPYTEYIVFHRNCVDGEIFTYRTEKYRPPLIIRSTVTTPEPSTLLLLGMGAAGLLVCRWRRPT